MMHKIKKYTQNWKSFFAALVNYAIFQIFSKFNTASMVLWFSLNQNFSIFKENIIRVRAKNIFEKIGARATK